MKIIRIPTNSKEEKKKEDSEKGFEITQERIAVINKATEYMKTIGDFSDCVSDNFYGTNVEQLKK